MNSLLHVWSDGADYALVTIEPAYALRLLEKGKLAQEVKARYGHFHQLTFFECGPVLFSGEVEGLETEEQSLLRFLCRFRAGSHLWRSLRVSPSQGKMLPFSALSNYPY